MFPILNLCCQNIAQQCFVHMGSVHYLNLFLHVLRFYSVSFEGSFINVLFVTCLWESSAVLNVSLAACHPIRLVLGFQVYNFIL